MGLSEVKNTSQVKTAFANVAAAQTDSSIVAAVAGKKLRVVGFIMTGNTATGTCTFNTKPGGAGSAISAAFTLSVGGVVPAPVNPHGWCQTNSGEGLTVTTTACGANIQVKYVEMN